MLLSSRRSAQRCIVCPPFNELLWRAAEAFSQSKLPEPGQESNKSVQVSSNVLVPLLPPIILRGGECVPISEPTVYRLSAAHRAPIRNVSRETRPTACRTRCYQTIQSRARGMKNPDSPLLQLGAVEILPGHNGGVCMYDILGNDMFVRKSK